MSLPFSARPQPPLVSVWSHSPPCSSTHSFDQQIVIEHVLYARPCGQSGIWQGPGRTCLLSLGNLQCLKDGRKAGGKFIDSLTFSFTDSGTCSLADLLMHSLIASLLPLTHPSNHWLIYSFRKHLLLPKLSQAWCCVLDKGAWTLTYRQRGAMEGFEQWRDPFQGVP